MIFFKFQSSGLWFQLIILCKKKKDLYLITIFIQNNRSYLQVRISHLSLRMMVLMCP